MATPYRRKSREVPGLIRQCGTCGHAGRFRVVPEKSGALDRVECRSVDHAEWLDRLNITTRFRSEMRCQGYIDLRRLEKLAGPDYGCPHWKPREAHSAVKSLRHG